MPNNSKWYKTFCGYCHANCGMEALIENGRLITVRGDAEFSGNRGRLCPKGAAAADVVYSPHRLKHPLVRTTQGFEKISWDKGVA
jgi:nitrate reductase NapA